MVRGRLRAGRRRCRSDFVGEGAAMWRWPLWMGSKVPPKSPMFSWVPWVWCALCLGFRRPVGFMGWQGRLKAFASGLPSTTRVGFAGGRVDDESVDGDVGGHKRVVADDFDGEADAVFYVVETSQPVVEVYAGVAQGFDAVVGDVAFVYFSKETGGVPALHAAVVVGDDHDFFDFEFETRRPKGCA